MLRTALGAAIAGYLEDPGETPADTASPDDNPLYPRMEQLEAADESVPEVEEEID